MSESKLCIQQLKKFAIEEIPKNDVLRELLLSEKDELNLTEFCCKLDVWLKLLRRVRL